MSTTVRAFMFHDVRDLSETNYPERYKLKSFLRKKDFEFQIEHILNRYEVIRSDELNKINYDDGKDYAVLTFDDGLFDHYYVYKYLKSKNISGTFLIPKLPVTTGKMIPTNKIQFILSVCDEKELASEILSCFEDKDEIWSKYSKTKWKNNWWSKEMIFITNILRNHKTNDFNNYEYMDFLFEKYVHSNEFEFSKDFYLNLEQIDEMSNNNMVIGGHGNTSENLLLIDDYEYDIKESFEFISKYSDKNIFSYPNGGYNDDIKEVMRRNNCDLSFTVNPMTITNLDHLDYLEFPRYDAPQKLPLL